MGKGKPMTEEVRLKLKQAAVNRKKAAVEAKVATERKIQELEDQVRILSERSSIPAQTQLSTAINIPDSDIQWFTEVDLNDKGKVASDYPAWYFSVNIENLAEDIKVLEEGIDEGVYQGKKMREAKDQLKVKKERYDKILEAKDNLANVNKDKISRSMKDFGEEIKRSLFSYDEMWKMNADPHQEADRMVKPCIEIKNDPVVGSFIKQHGRMKVVDGKISRNDASVIYKSMAKALGENTDIESLRRVK